MPNAIGGSPTTGTLLAPLCVSPLPKLRLSNGDERPITLADIDRFEVKITTDGDCWTWSSTRTACGYGKFSFRDNQIRAHRFAYLVAHGSIPAGLVLDHLCRNRACCNPDHLEAVTQEENVRRGKVAEPGNRRSTKQEIDAVVRPLYDQLGARPTLKPILAALRNAGLSNSPITALESRRRIEITEPALAQYPTRTDILRVAVLKKTHCNNGHPYEGSNAGRQGKDCLVCGRLRWARRTGKDPDEIGGRPTHCPLGHAYEGRNIVLNSNGHMSCRACKNASASRAHARKRAAEAASIGPCGHESRVGNACDRPRGHKGQHHAQAAEVSA